MKNALLVSLEIGLEALRRDSPKNVMRLITRHLFGLFGLFGLKWRRSGDVQGYPCSLLTSTDY